MLQRLSPSRGAVRARQSRARQRAGLMLYSGILDRRRFLAALRAAGRFDDPDATRQEIEREVAAVLEDFCTRWLTKKPCA
jgi:hypothetical protein